MAETFEEKFARLEKLMARADFNRKIAKTLRTTVEYINAREGADITISGGSKMTDKNDGTREANVSVCFGWDTLATHTIRIKYDGVGLVVDDQTATDLLGEWTVEREIDHIVVDEDYCGDEENAIEDAKDRMEDGGYVFDGNTAVAQLVTSAEYRLGQVVKCDNCNRFHFHTYLEVVIYDNDDEDDTGYESYHIELEKR